MAKQPNLKDAYAMSTADEVRALYSDWAYSYDAGFGEAQGYQLPREVAQAFLATGASDPVLDVGAGTGLVADYLRASQSTQIDALDLSNDMLEIARMKGLYQEYLCADVTQPLSFDQAYQGVVSAGTFTLGHVGPIGVTRLLDAVSPGCQFVISVNAAHFEGAGFADVLKAEASRITSPVFRDVRIYDDRADGAHRDDIARLLIFSRT